MFTRKKFGARNEDCRFQRWHPAQTYTMFASEKVSEQNENCRFQPAYVRKANYHGWLKNNKELSLGQTQRAKCSSKQGIFQNEAP